jgi:hypothetical protein
MNDESTAGGFDLGESIGITAMEGITAGGLDSGNDNSHQADWLGQDQDHLNFVDEMMKRTLAAGSQPYGQNAAQRWSGTPAIGLSIFKPRSPIYGTDLKGRTRQRIDGSTHIATPPDGLIGGRALESASRGGPVTSLTPENQWRGLFPASPHVTLNGGGGNGFESSYVQGASERNQNGRKTITSQYGTGYVY